MSQIHKFPLWREASQAKTKQRLFYNIKFYTKRGINYGIFQVYCCFSSRMSMYNNFNMIFYTSQLPEYDLVLNTLSEPIFNGVAG